MFKRGNHIHAFISFKRVYHEEHGIYKCMHVAILVPGAIACVLYARLHEQLLSARVSQQCLQAK